MSILTQLNSPFLYIVCGAIILFIAAVSLFFLIRAYRAGKAMGIDVTSDPEYVTNNLYDN